MGRGGIFLALLVAAGGAFLTAPLLGKASDYLRSYRPDPFRSASANDGETARMLRVGGESLAEQLRRHRANPPDHKILSFHARSFVTEEQQDHGL